MDIKNVCVNSTREYYARCLQVSRGTTENNLTTSWSDKNW